MNDLTPSYEPGTGRVILEGLPAGPAGEARLVPVTDLDLAFDRASGQLVRVVVDAGGPGAELLIRLFGPQAPSVLAETVAGRAERRALAPDVGLCAALSSLARLDSARVSSPVSHSSPWWAAEACVLAEHAGLTARAQAEARQAVRALAGRPLPAPATRTAAEVARIAAPDDPAAARQLRANLARTRQAPAPTEPGLDVAAEVAALAKDQVRLPGLHWVLDPRLVPAGLFRPGLSPHSDLLVGSEGAGGRVVVGAILTPDSERAALARCQARLVDPGVRRILSQAPFTGAGARVRAELGLSFPLNELDETWIEVVEGDRRPVLSAQWHRIRRAVRWADAALRAERRPPGVAPRASGQDWAALATAAWDRCRRDWEAAGDADRAFLAAQRAASHDPRACPPEAPSAAAARVATLTPLPEPSYLAELFGA
jgi:hypothetical protein